MNSFFSSRLLYEVAYGLMVKKKKKKKKKKNSVPALLVNGLRNTEHKKTGRFEYKKLNTDFTGRFEYKKFNTDFTG